MSFRHAEVQSATSCPRSELDTAKEELQSTNEELSTLNDELSGRNEELSTVNSDLSNLLSSVQIAIAIVTRDLGIRRFTPAAEKVMNMIPSEDHKDTAELLSELLNEEGYEVRTAHSTKEALAADLDNVDLLISDIGLPDGTGLDLMRGIRAGRPLKGVALSGYGTEADIRASEEVGFSAHLTKPIEFERLLVTIREVSGSGR